MRALMQIGYRVRRFVLRVLRIRTCGVKVMVFNREGELLLVRNSYGRTDLFVLPGGGIGRSETPEAAASREVREETGLAVERLAFVSRHLSRAEGKRDTIHLFRAEADGEPVADSREVEQARFFPLDRLPQCVSASTLRRIAEHRGEAAPDGLW
jgi:ADP-ribose pyrophosphatase YjhB (NUDIX family)